MLGKTNLLFRFKTQNKHINSVWQKIGMLREQTSATKCSPTWAKTPTGEAKEPIENGRRQCVGYGENYHVSYFLFIIICVDATRGISITTEAVGGKPCINTHLSLSLKLVCFKSPAGDDCSRLILKAECNLTS
ncbi:hypothetical protein PoB_005754800 [Plakobranchus ocellatus]|uniref:Uncharacterized protein n=1 Tax=Plakobranchus ocellatus TaxID=259542 RepID=A0AAV4CGG8_9GAST|nr:hypothetical protein PoB_005754800 [Plakobranchus ocellatus]